MFESKTQNGTKNALSASISNKGKFGYTVILICIVSIMVKTVSYIVYDQEMFLPNDEISEILIENGKSTLAA